MIRIILMKFTSCKTLHQIAGRLCLSLVLLPLAWGQSLARLKEGGVVHHACALASNQAEDESQQQVKVFGISQPNVCHFSNIMKPLRTMDFWLRSTFPQDWRYLESTFLQQLSTKNPFEEWTSWPRCVFFMCWYTWHSWYIRSAHFLLALTVAQSSGYL